MFNSVVAVTFMIGFLWFLLFVDLSALMVCGL